MATDVGVPGVVGGNELDEWLCLCIRDPRSEGGAAFFVLPLLKIELLSRFDCSDSLSDQPCPLVPSGLSANSRRGAMADSGGLYRITVRDVELTEQTDDDDDENTAGRTVSGSGSRGKNIFLKFEFPDDTDDPDPPGGCLLSVGEKELGGSGKLDNVRFLSSVPSRISGAEDAAWARRPCG